MLISPIQLTELISFCDSGVLAFDVFVNGVLVMFQMLTKMRVCGGGKGLVYSLSQQLVEYSDYRLHFTAIKNNMELSPTLATTAAL